MVVVVVVVAFLGRYLFIYWLSSCLLASKPKDFLAPKLAIHVNTAVSKVIKAHTKKQTFNTKTD